LSHKIKLWIWRNSSSSSREYYTHRNSLTAYIT